MIAVLTVECFSAIFANNSTHRSQYICVSFNLPHSSLCFTAAVMNSIHAFFSNWVHYELKHGLVYL